MLNANWEQRPHFIVAQKYWPLAPRSPFLFNDAINAGDVTTESVLPVSGGVQFLWRAVGGSVSSGLNSSPEQQRIWWGWLLFIKTQISKWWTCKQRFNLLSMLRWRLFTLHSIYSIHIFSFLTLFYCVHSFLFAFISFFLIRIFIFFCYWSVDVLILFSADFYFY